MNEKAKILQLKHAIAVACNELHQEDPFFVSPAHNILLAALDGDWTTVEEYRKNQE